MAPFTERWGIHLSGVRGSVDAMYLASYLDDLFRISRRRFGNNEVVFRVLKTRHRPLSGEP